MKIKALVSFAGAVSMRLGEIKEIGDDTAADLISAGYAEKLPDTGEVEKNEGKRNNGK